MSIKNSATIQCPACNGSQNISYYSSITASINPELRDAVLNETFFDIICVRCHTVITFDHPVLYSDPHKRWMVWYLPEGATSESNEAMDDSSVMLGNIIKRRVVYSRSELTEKVHAIETDINDWTLVLLKMFLDKNRDETWYYAGLINNGERLRFNSPELKVWESVPYNDKVRIASVACESLDEGLEWVHTSKKNLFLLGQEKLDIVFAKMR